jgi:anthranilate synthase / indole-3-glycerol phosphate synthase / phosphoribosylanthranilate isomerase
MRPSPLPFTVTPASLSQLLSLLSFSLAPLTSGVLTRCVCLDIQTNRVSVFFQIYHHTPIADSQFVVQDMSTTRKGAVPDPTSGVLLVANDDISNHPDGKDPKSPRSKERRRRGKDPLKELLKGGKKSKILSKSLKLAEVDSNGVGSSNTLPAVQESTHSRRSRELSLTSSSRSLSTASTSNCRTPSPPSQWAGPLPSLKQGTHENHDPRAFSISDASNSLPTSSQNQPVPDSHSSDHSLHPDRLTHAQSPDLPNSCISTSSSTSHSSSMFSSDLDMTSTSSLSDKTPTLETEDPSYSSPRNVISTSATLPSVRKDLGPWDLDSAPSSSTSDNTLRKPPRFRSKSRGSGRPPASPTTPGFNVTSASDSEPTALPSSATAGLHDDDSHPLTFPTLNSASGPPTNASNRITNYVTSNGNGNGTSVSSSGNSHSNGTTSKRAPTPRRPTTPLSGTNTPPNSLSAQTQLASLRGALEAARLREEKSKAEIERCSKDLEMMRWENTTWRRREMEVGPSFYS